MILAKADIKGAYTQSGPAQGNVYVRPPRELHYDYVLWLLLATMYGLVSEGRKFQLVSDGVFTQVLELSIVIAMPQLFFKFEKGQCVLAVAKYVDDLVIAARNNVCKARHGISQAFLLGLWVVAPQALNVNSTTVSYEQGRIVIQMHEIYEEFQSMVVDVNRRKEPLSNLLADEARSLRSRAGLLNYLGTALSPICCLGASYIQQRLPSMTVSDIRQVNGIIKYVIKELHIVIVFGNCERGTCLCLYCRLYRCRLSSQRHKPRRSSRGVFIGFGI